MKPLRCWLGWHKWVSVPLTVDGRDIKRICPRCGRWEYEK